jgi:N-carbamoylputrescine amidase
VTLDLARIETARTHWPFLRDRRIDAYGGLVERFIDA